MNYNLLTNLTSSILTDWAFGGINQILTSIKKGKGKAKALGNS